MTNEELATAVREGRADEIELWTQVLPFVQYMARNLLFRLNRREYMGVDIDDLTQVGYFALRDAVKDFDPSSGYTFLTYLKNHLRKAFAEACGYRTSKRNPLNSCTSLDVPIGENEDDLIINHVVDLSDQYAAADERMYMKDLHEVLDAVLGRLNDKGADMLRRFFWEGETLSETAAKVGRTKKQAINQRYWYIRQLRTVIRTTPEGANLLKFLNAQNKHDMGAPKEKKNA